MMEEKDRILRHLADLCDRAERIGRWEYSAFLTPAEQEDWISSPLSGGRSFHFYGGYDGAERRLMAAGDTGLCGEEPAYPLSVLHIFPQAPRFAEDLSHRDYLGALMNLGFDRSQMGDLTVRDREAWVYCLQGIAGFLSDGLSQVRRTPVRIEEVPTDHPSLLPRLEPMTMNVASERADAVICAWIGVSRGHVSELFSKNLVFLNSRPLTDRGKGLKAGDILSVRGYGKARYDGPRGETRKGRLVVSLQRYT